MSLFDKFLSWVVNPRILFVFMRYSFSSNWVCIIIAKKNILMEFFNCRVTVKVNNSVKSYCLNLFRRLFDEFGKVFLNSTVSESCSFWLKIDSYTKNVAIWSLISLDNAPDLKLLKSLTNILSIKENKSSKYELAYGLWVKKIMHLRVHKNQQLDYREKL